MSEENWDLLKFFVAVFGPLLFAGLCQGFFGWYYARTIPQKKMWRGFKDFEDYD